MRSFTKQINDFITANGGTVNIMMLNPSELQRSKTYGESKVKKYFPAIPIPAFIYFNPSEEMLTEAGMEKEFTEILVKVPLGSLRQKNLMKQDGNCRITQDDLMLINGNKYKVYTVKPAVHLKEHQIYYLGGIRA
jgi:hypothetical protein